MLGAVLLLWTPVVNRYPLVYPDTGVYIWSSVRFGVPQDRVIGYGLWLRAADLVSPGLSDNVNSKRISARALWRLVPVHSLWSVIVWQAFGTSYLLVTLAEIVLARARRRTLLTAIVLGMTALTTVVSVYVGAVMPDILSSWILLGVFVFLLAREAVDRWLAAALLALAIFTHNTHLFLALSMVGIVAVPLLFSQSWRARFAARIKSLSLVVAGTVAGMVLTNMVLGAGPVIVRGSNTFLLNRFAESGVLTQTLALNCDAQAWRLCAYQDTIAAHRGVDDWYLYSAEKPSAVVGWQNAPDEQGAIIAAAVKCCTDEIVQSSLQESWRQFWLLNIRAHYARLNDNMNAVTAIQNVYPREYATFQAGVQQSGSPIAVTALPFDEQSSQMFFLALTLLLVIICFVLRYKLGALLLLGALIFLIVNIIAPGIWNGAHPRYQGRVFWMLPYLDYLVAIGAMQWYLYRRARSESVLPARDAASHI